MLDVRLAVVGQQFRCADRADLRRGFGQALVRVLDRLDDSSLHVLHVILVDAAGERALAPETEGIGPLVVMCAGNADVGESVEFLADRLGDGIEQADDIRTRERNLVLTVREYGSTDVDWIVDL